MKREKTDLAAGRLGDLASRKKDPRRAPGRKEHAGYGAERLGISSHAAQDEAPVAEEGLSFFDPDQSQERAAELELTAAGPSQPAGTSLRSARQEARAILRGIADRPAPEPEPAPRPVRSARGPAAWAASSRFAKPVAAAIGGLLLLGLVWAIWSAASDDEGPAKSPAAARDPNLQRAGARKASLPPGIPEPGPAEEHAPLTPPVGRRPVPGDGPATDPPALDKQEAWLLPAELERPEPASPPRPEPPATAPAERPTQPVPPARPAFREPPPGIRCTGIMSVSDGLVAIINDRLMRVGQKVNGAKIVEIRQFAVLMELDGQRFSIGLSEGSSGSSSGGGEAKEGGSDGSQPPSDDGSSDDAPAESGGE